MFRKFGSCPPIPPARPPEPWRQYPSSPEGWGVKMEWKRTIINSNLSYYRQSRPMTLNWNWMKMPPSDLNNQSSSGCHHRWLFNFQWPHLCLLSQSYPTTYNALVRIAIYLDPKSKSIIYKSFIRSNFEYCPLVERLKTINLKRYKSDHCEFFNIHISYHMKNY